jgi:hypothetical protein
MKKLFLLPVSAAMLVAAGCRDAQVERIDRAPVQMEITGPRFSVSGVVEGPSTLCVAYQGRLEDAQKEAAAQPDDTDLQEIAAGLESFVADNCSAEATE